MGDRTRRSAGLRQIAFIVAVSAMSVVVAACGGAPGSSPTPGTSTPTSGPAGLEGRTFLSTDVTVGGKPFELAPGTQVRLAFQGNGGGAGGGTLSASAGCNSIGGQYRIETGHLIFSGGSMTEMACPGARGQQDAWLVGILSAGPVVRLDGNTLTLVTDAPTNTTISMLDLAVAQPDQPLAGPSWIVTAVLSGDVAASVPAGIFATLTFQSGGTIDVSTGCNTGSGGWAVSDNRLRITELSLTKKACPPPVGPFESQLLEILRSGQLTYAIDGFSMTLMAGTAGVQLQAPGLD
ncbi:MAG TPA: META domain-containing protein [Candidatus Limnocylindrales bacterium]|nr:META domain-containing protein [Candidatus Limnocylindrales bacterium]